MVSPDTRHFVLGRPACLHLQDVTTLQTAPARVREMPKATTTANQMLRFNRRQHLIAMKL